MGSSLSNPFTGLEACIAASTTFQTLVGAANATAAKNKIFYPYATSDDARPYCVLDCEGLGPQRVVSFSERGSIVASFEIPASTYSAETGAKAKFLACLDDVDSILDEAVTASRQTSTRWGLTEFSIVQFPFLVEDQDGDPVDPYYATSVQVSWV